MQNLSTGSVQGSAVVVGENAALFIGPSGSGKSSNCLEIMALGGTLISDDLVTIESRSGGLYLNQPAHAMNAIEVRRVGIVGCETVSIGALRLVVDLGQSEQDRLPPRRSLNIDGNSVDLIYGAGIPSLAQAVYFYLKYGREH